MGYSSGGGPLGTRGQGHGGIYRSEGDFVVDAGLNGEPVELNKGKGDVLPRSGVGENPARWVLSFALLEPVQGLAGH